MGIGHVAVGLALKRTDPRLNVGWLIFAALLCDFLLGCLVLAGSESYIVPPDYASRRYLLFTFPWSHGLLADCGWAALASFAAWILTRRRSAAVAVAIAVLSHFLLDGTVHVKGLPLAMADGPAFGLGLWRYLPMALSAEAALAALGLWTYWRVVNHAGPRRRVGMLIYVTLLTLFLLGGQAASSRLPERSGLIASWLIAPLAMSGIALVLDRSHPRAAS